MFTEESKSGLKPMKPYVKGDYTLIETKLQLEELCETLQGQSIVGVDAENNSTNSYEGYLCLL